VIAESPPPPSPRIQEIPVETEKNWEYRKPQPKTVLEPEAGGPLSTTSMQDTPMESLPPYEDQMVEEDQIPILIFNAKPTPSELSILMSESPTDENWMWRTDLERRMFVRNDGVESPMSSEDVVKHTFYAMTADLPAGDEPYLNPEEEEMRRNMMRKALIDILRQEADYFQETEEPDMHHNRPYCTISLVGGDWNCTVDQLPFPTKYMLEDGTEVLMTQEEKDFWIRPRTVQEIEILQSEGKNRAVIPSMVWHLREVRTGPIADQIASHVQSVIGLQRELPRSWSPLTTQGQEIFESRQWRIMKIPKVPPEHCIGTLETEDEDASMEEFCNEIWNLPDHRLNATERETHSRWMRGPVARWIAENRQPPDGWRIQEQLLQDIEIAGISEDQSFDNNSLERLYNMLQPPE
jgi:hypothetical protein